MSYRTDPLLGLEDARNENRHPSLCATFGPPAWIARAKRGLRVHDVPQPAPRLARRFRAGFAPASLGEARAFSGLALLKYHSSLLPPTARDLLRRCFRRT